MSRDSPREGNKRARGRPRVGQGRSRGRPRVGQRRAGGLGAEDGLSEGQRRARFQC